MSSEQHSAELELEDWLSLHDASALVGVAESTLRRWGDLGRVPVRRTLGGHRRFQRAALLRLLETGPETPAAAPHAEWGIDERALSQEHWHARFSIDLDPERMRRLGQRLLGVLMQYINRRDHDQRFLAEAREVSGEYGREARQAGVSMYNTIEAFVFFRRSFLQVARPLAGGEQLSEPARLLELHDRLDRFMEAILLGTVAGFENAAPPGQSEE
ncbi:MAG TPA: helix-turn-helix domain-containing protein [Herpetosiphonaceae bacterium]